MSTRTLLCGHFNGRAGRCGAQILQKKSRNTGDTRVWRWPEEIHICEFFSGHLRSKKSLFPQWEPVFFAKSARNLLEKWHFWCRVGPLQLLLSESPEIPIKIVFWRGWDLEAKPFSLSFDECYVWGFVPSWPGHLRDPWKTSKFLQREAFFGKMCPKPARKVHFWLNSPSCPGSTPSISPVGSRFGKSVPNNLDRQELLKTYRGGKHRGGEGSETFLARK